MQAGMWAGHRTKPDRPRPAAPASNLFSLVLKVRQAPPSALLLRGPAAPAVHPPLPQTQRSTALLNCLNVPGHVQWYQTSLRSQVTNEQMSPVVGSQQGYSSGSP